MNFVGQSYLLSSSSSCIQLVMVQTFSWDRAKFCSELSPYPHDCGEAFIQLHRSQMTNCSMCLNGNLIGRYMYRYFGAKSWKRKHKTKILKCQTYDDSLAPVTEESLWQKLKPAISYLSPVHMETVQKALKVAFEAHNGQKRRSGDPFIIHPMEVACILAELELDWETLAAGLLHDTVEDTNFVTFERLEREFGPAVRRIVEGETKVSKLGKLQYANLERMTHDVKADDLRQMFLAMTEEVRVIIVKLADRLHNMRTLMYMPLHKQRHIALETLQVFAPLAKLLGMYKIKSELEDLSFMYLHPEDYNNLKRRVEEVYSEHEQEALEARRFLLKRISDDQFLSFMAVDVNVKPSRKELYSIYKKLLEECRSINNVRDIAQLRIILSTKQQTRIGPVCNGAQICYHVLGLIHQAWSPVPKSMKDYIATPKPNGYQCLHTKVLPFLYENTFQLEIQIRTKEMDLLAERGIASYYNGRSNLLQCSQKAKDSSSFMNGFDLARRVGWLKSIREWQEEFVGNMSAREFVDTVTGDLLGSRVFVFTPKGEIKNLPKGATVIDYAYQIHTELGNKMVAAKVNGNLVSPAHILANAEVVEVITYEALSSKAVFHRHRQWLYHAKTRSARHKITKYLREQAALSAFEVSTDIIKNHASEGEESNIYLGRDCGTTMMQNSRYSEDLVRPALSKWKLDTPRLIVSSANLSGKLTELSNVYPQINGNHSKRAEEVVTSLKGALGSQQEIVVGAMNTFFLLNYHELVRSIEDWKVERLTLWYDSENCSIQWISVFCFNRTRMLAEVTAAICSAGLSICQCVAETDKDRRLGMLLFHVEGDTKDLVTACTSVGTVVGVINWSSGCSWKRNLASAEYI